MRGRHPKPPEQRQRRNKTIGAAVLKVAPDQLAIAPPPASTTAPAPPVQPVPKRAPTAKAKSRARPATRRRSAAQAKKAGARKRSTRPGPSPPSPSAAPIAPAAPELPATHHWHPQTLAWWEEIWISPMVAQWLAADRHVLNRLAVLVNEYWHRPTATLLAEIRQQEARFGLTPMDRHRLQWKLEPGPAAAGAPADDAEEQPPMADPRETLRLVK